MAPRASASSARAAARPSASPPAPVRDPLAFHSLGCEARKAESRKALAMLSGCAACMSEVMAFAGACKTDPLGTWMIAATNPALQTKDGAATGYGFTYQVVREPVCSDAADSGPCPQGDLGEPHEVTVRLDQKQPVRWSTFDFDHDGVPEVIVTAGDDADVISAQKGSPPPPGAAVAWHVERYKPASGVAFSGVEDVDHDGRPDLLLKGGYPGPALFVGHSLPDGTFSATDDVAKAAFATSCPKAGEELKDLPTKEPSSLMRRIACARARGATAADVVTALAPLRVPNPNLRPAKNGKDAAALPATALPMLIEAAASRQPLVKLP